MTIMASKKARLQKKQREKQQAEVQVEVTPKTNFLQKGHDFVAQALQKQLTKDNLIRVGGEVFNVLMQNTIPSQKEAMDFARGLEGALYSGMSLAHVLPDHIPDLAFANAFVLNKMTGYSDVIYDTVGATEFSNANRQIGRMITLQAINFVSAIPSMLSTVTSKVKSLCGSNPEVPTAANPHRIFKEYKKEYVRGIQRENDGDEPSDGLKIK